MDGKERATDNRWIERFWRTLKYEEVYLNDYQSPREARQRLRRYFDFYNSERPHQSLDYRTPAQIYFMDQLLTKRFLKKGKENFSAAGASLAFQDLGRSG